MKIIYSSFFIVLLVSCSGGLVRLSNEGKSVKISNSLPPIQLCKEVGEVYANANDNHDDLERMVRSVRNQIRNETAQKGGNYVMIETNNTTGSPAKSYLVLSGTAYKCTAPEEEPEVVPELKPVQPLPQPVPKKL